MRWCDTCGATLVVRHLWCDTSKHFARTHFAHEVCERKVFVDVQCWLTASVSVIMVCASYLPHTTLHALRALRVGPISYLFRPDEPSSGRALLRTRPPPFSMGTLLPGPPDGALAGHQKPPPPACPPLSSPPCPPQNAHPRLQRSSFIKAHEMNDGNAAALSCRCVLLLCAHILKHGPCSLCHSTQEYKGS